MHQIAGEATGNGSGSEDTPADVRGEHARSLDDGDQKDSDVVSAAMVVGGVNKGSAGLIKLGLSWRTGRELAAENGCEGFDVELAGKAIGTEKVDVARFDAIAVGVRLKTGIRADGSRDVVAHRRDSSFIGGDLSGLELLFDEGMVMGELLKSSGA